MREKVRWLFYVFIFFVGYCANLIMPVEFFMGGSVKLTAGVADGYSRDIASVDKNILPSAEQSAGEPVKTVATAVRPTDRKSPAVAIETPLSERPEDTAALQGELAVLRDYRMQVEIKKHEELMQLRGGTVESLNDSFKREPVDAAWAKDKEKLINHLVEGSEYLSQVPHMDSECKSTQCKFSVLSDDQFYLTKLSGAMDKVVADQGSSFSSYTTVIDEKTHTTSIYFERN